MRLTLLRRKKPLIIALSIIGIVVVTALYAWQNYRTWQQTPRLPNQTDSRLHVAAMGDMLAHDTIIANAKTASGYDFGRYFQKVRPLYEDADIIFCNQEGLSSGPAYGISGYPAFNAPVEFASGLKEGAGCNFVNLANNHIGDKGAAATSATVDFWKQLRPLALSGANKAPADQRQVSYAEVKGIKIGFVSFADFNNNTGTPAYSVNLYHDEALVRRLVGEARSQADLVIVSMHWGTEGSAATNDDQKAQVNLLASLGTDVIIGTGPHVLQKVERVTRPDGDQMVVWYSLGNMLSSQLSTPELFSGVALFDVVKSSDGTVKIENLAFRPTYMHYEWTADEKSRGDLLARRNVMMYPLSEAAAPLARSLLDTTVEAQRRYIIDTLGPEVIVR
jgi:poly-gamma-glutamate capsule biosynthesis protein CapA/YwtB (metallophosphatase superfamily)